MDRIPVNINDPASPPLTASTSSSRVARGTPTQSVIVKNTGLVTAYLRSGDVTVVATTSHHPIAPGEISLIDSDITHTHIAGITASGSAVVLIINTNGK